MVKARSGLLWRCWGEECLVYCDLTGSTHLLNSHVAELLKSLEGQSQTLSQLQESSLEMFGDARVDDVNAWLDESLHQLKRLGLIDSTLP